MSDSFCITGSSYYEPFGNIQQPNGNININYTFSCSGTSSTSFDIFETREEKAKRIREERKKKLERVFNEKYFDNIKIPECKLFYLDFKYESIIEQKQKERRKKIERILNE